VAARHAWTRNSSINWKSGMCRLPQHVATVCRNLLREFPVFLEGVATPKAGKREYPRVWPVVAALKEIALGARDLILVSQARLLI